MNHNTNRVRRYLKTLSNRPYDESDIELILNYISYFEEDDLTLDAVKEFIIDNSLNSKSRKADVVNKRAYMYTYIKNKWNTMSLDDIGKLFNRDHATVICGLRRHYNMIDTNDESYEYSISALKNRFKV